MIHLVDVNELVININVEPDWNTVETYKNMLMSSSSLEPIKACMYCGSIIDGWHRIQALRELGIRKVKVDWIKDEKCELKNHFHE